MVDWSNAELRNYYDEKTYITSLFIDQEAYPSVEITMIWCTPRLHARIL